MPDKPINLFISHASEDKEAFVKGLADTLRANPKFDVWYDDYTLRLGDSLLESITKGLHSCDYGIVVVSPAFIPKRWTSNELNGLFALETKERKIILPIWHNVTEEQVLTFNAILADRKAIPSTKSLQEIVFAIEFATGVSQRMRELAKSSLEERAVQLKKQIIKTQLSKSFEGVELVKRNAAFVLDRFEQLITEEVQDAITIKLQRYDTPTDEFPWPCIVASGPYNTNIEVGYANKSANRIADNMLFTQMFNWNLDFPVGQKKGERRGGRLIHFLPEITAERDVRWRDEATDGPYLTGEQIAQRVVQYLLALAVSPHVGHQIVTRASPMLGERVSRAHETV
jgi:hypothetical protein